MGLEDQRPGKVTLRNLGGYGSVRSEIRRYAGLVISGGFVTLRPTAAARGARPAAVESVRPAGCPRPPAARPYRVPAPAPTPALGRGRRRSGCAAPPRARAAARRRYGPPRPGRPGAGSPAAG